MAVNPPTAVGVYHPGTVADIGPPPCGPRTRLTIALAHGGGPGRRMRFRHTPHPDRRPLIHRAVAAHLNS